jgi:hypothetical protein
LPATRSRPAVQPLVPPACNAAAPLDYYGDTNRQELTSATGKMSDQLDDQEEGSGERDTESSASKYDAATQPLSDGGKALAFFGGSLGLGCIAIFLVARWSIKFSRRGEKRKARDVWKWFGLGFLVLISLLVLLGLLQTEPSP